MDIDIDYDFSHKDEIVAFEAKSNGWDHFAKIQTFTTLSAKEVLRDTTRVAGEPVAVGNKFSSLIPGDNGITLEQAWK